MKHTEFREILDSLFDGVYYVDSARKILFWNKAAERLTGYRTEEMIGRACYDNILDHVDETGKHLCLHGCPLQDTIQDGKHREATVFLRQKNGIRRPVNVRTAPVRDEKGNITGAVEIFSDSSAHLAALEELQRLRDSAYVDHLTQIYNRRSMETYLDSKLNELRANSWVFGVCIADVDSFKPINDRLGHSAGDEVLRMVADVISHSSRSFDIVGRWGGDEFLSIFADVDKKLLVRIAERHRVLIEKSHLRIGDEIMHMTISAGATLARPDDTIETLVERADELLYKSKQSGRNTLTVD